jgi:hypothetical protein
MYYLYACLKLHEFAVVEECNQGKIGGNLEVLFLLMS